MKTSASGLSFIAHEEGTVLHVYIDQVGVPTIGVGHALLPGESFPNGITEQQALDILSKDVGKAERAISSLVHVDLDQNEFDALVSFVFNVGEEAFKGSTMLRLLNQGNYLGAANEFPKWTRGGGVILPVLVGRRQRERALFLKPMVPEVPVVPPVVQPPPVPVTPPTVVPVPIVVPPAPKPSVPWWIALINLIFKRGT